MQRERRRRAAHWRCARGDEGTQYTCFAGTKVQTLTQKLAPQVIHRACKDVLEESKVLGVLAVLGLLALLEESKVLSLLAYSAQK